MLYLAWKISTANISNEKITGTPPSFTQMVLFQWINPKAWSMSSVAAMAFTSRDGSVIFKAILIELIFY